LKKHIPNAITCCNLLCGCLSVYFSMQINEAWASVLIFAALVFDFFDGLVARALKVHSPIGKELDSLADVISFGVAPAFILMNLFTYHTLNVQLSLTWLKFSSFLVPVFAALRLAKFNIDPRQSDMFFGLPSPSTGIFVAALPLIFLTNGFLKPFLINPWVLVGIAVFLSGMMVAEVPLFSFKIKGGTARSKKIQMVFVFIALILVLFFSISAIPMIILLYILLSVIGKKYFYSGN
jgi:CDP-diacylglycerol---serine O-phosphatidyltransferase